MAKRDALGRVIPGQYTIKSVRRQKPPTSIVQMARHDHLGQQGERRRPLNSQTSGKVAALQQRRRDERVAERDTAALGLMQISRNWV